MKSFDSISGNIKISILLGTKQEKEYIFKWDNTYTNHHDDYPEASLRRKLKCTTSMKRKDIKNSTNSFQYWKMKLITLRRPILADKIMTINLLSLISFDRVVPLFQEGKKHYSTFTKINNPKNKKNDVFFQLLCPCQMLNQVWRWLVDVNMSTNTLENVLCVCQCFGINPYMSRKVQ